MTSPLQQAKTLHKEIKLCGVPKNAILQISEPLFDYLYSLLQDEPITCPAATLVEWQQWIENLREHWILPLLYYKIAQLPAEYRPPGPIFSTLRSSYHHSASGSLQTELQIQEIQQLFEEAQIPMLVMKGPAIGRTVYSTPTLRASSDLDLLVKPSHVIKAREILIKQGYLLAEKSFEKFQHFLCEEVFHPPSTARHYRSVEIHWSLCNNTQEQAPDLSPLFERAVPVVNNSLTFWTLDPVDTFIQAVLHALEHHCLDLRINWCYDISLLFQKIIDSNLTTILLERSLEWQATQAVEKMLQISNFWTGAPTLEQIEALFPDGEIVKNGTLTWETTTFHPQKRFQLYLSNSSGLKEKASILTRILFPDASYMRSAYPKSGRFPLFRAHCSRWRFWTKTLVSRIK